MLPNISIKPSVSNSNSIIGSRAYTFLDSYVYMKNQRYNAFYEKQKEILAIENDAISIKSANSLYMAFLEEAKMLDSVVIRIRNFALRIKPDVINNIKLLIPTSDALNEFDDIISSNIDIPRMKYIKYDIAPIKYENMASFMNLYRMEISQFTSINTQTANQTNPFIRDKAASFLIDTAMKHANCGTELLEMESIKILNKSKLKNISDFFKQKNRFISTVNRDFKTFQFYLRQYSGLREIVTLMKPTELRNGDVLVGSSNKPITFNDYYVLYKHFYSMIKYMINIISYHERQFFNKIYALQGNIESYVSVVNDVLDLGEKQELEKSSINDALNESIDIVSNITNETIETSITKPLLPKMVTLYHGSDKQLSSIKPVSVNVGTRLSKTRKSSFWCLTKDTPLLMAVEQYIFDSVNIHGILTPLVPKNEIVYPKEYKDIILKSLKNMTIYVYKKDIEKKYVSRGHYIGIDEYTLDIEVTPDSVEEYNLSDIKDSIKFIPLKEIEDIITNFKENNKMSSDIKSNIIEKLIYYNTDKYWSKLKNAKKKLNEPLSESSEILNNSLNETISYKLISLDETKSTIDKNFEPKGKLNLSSFEKVHIDKNIINKYKKEYPMLKHVRCEDTDDYICDGYMWLDGENLVCTIGSCEYRDTHEKYIVSLEVMDKYKGYGLSKQLLKFAINTMKCSKLSVNKNNEVAKKVYDDFGFKVFHQDDSMYYMEYKSSLNESYDDGFINSDVIDSHNLINGNYAAHELLYDNINTENESKENSDNTDGMDELSNDSIEGVDDETISNFEEYDGQPREVDSICTLRYSLNL